MPESRIMEVVGRSWTSRQRLRQELSDFRDSPKYDRTLYLSSITTTSLSPIGISPNVIAGSSDLGTGAAIFYGDKFATVVIPPFPLQENSDEEGVDIDPMLDLLERPVIVGVVLLRLGQYAVGVIKDGKLLASKSGSRYVKNRHRKGGSSQRRFERSRERLMLELFGKVCSVTEKVFSPYERVLDYMLMGGERQTLLSFTKKCGYITRSGIEILPRRLDVNRPGKAALESIDREVWMSRVIQFELRDS